MQRRALMVDYELDELRREFLGEAREKVEEMQSTVDGSDRSRQTLDRLTYLAHQLKGSGGSYGYPQISDDATQLENAVESLAAQNVDGASLEEKIRTHIANLGRAIENAMKELG